LWRLLIQGYLLLPLLANLWLNLLLLALGESGENLAFRVVLGVAVSLAFGLAFGLVIRLAVGVVISLVMAVAFALAFGLAVRMAVFASGIVAFFLGIGLIYNVPIGVTFSKVVRIAASAEAVVKPMLKFLRVVAICPLTAIGNNVLYQIDKRLIDTKPSLLRYNSAFWDEWQHQPLKNLDKHLILVMERNPDEGKAAIKYLSTRTQRWAAQAALIEMDTWRIEGCADLEAIRQVHKNLTTRELELEILVGSLIRSFSRFSEDVDAALNQVTTYNQRLSLKAVADRLDALSRELTTSNDEYAIRLQPSPIRWSQIITNHVDKLTKTSEHS
jgi:hypothetical protein